MLGFLNTYTCLMMPTWIVKLDHYPGCAWWSKEMWQAVHWVPLELGWVVLCNIKVCLWLITCVAAVIVPDCMITWRQISIYSHGGGCQIGWLTFEHIALFLHTIKMSILESSAFNMCLCWAINLSRVKGRRLEVYPDLNIDVTTFVLKNNCNSKAAKG